MCEPLRVVSFRFTSSSNTRNIYYFVILKALVVLSILIRVKCLKKSADCCIALYNLRRTEHKTLLFKKIPVISRDIK